MNDTSRELLRPETVRALIECVEKAVRSKYVDLAALMFNQKLVDLGELTSDEVSVRALKAIAAGICWEQRDEIQPLIPIFEYCYTRSHRNFNSIHRYLDGLLEKDGYEFCRDRLIHFRRHISHQSRKNEHELHNLRLNDQLDRHHHV